MQKGVAKKLNSETLNARRWSESLARSQRTVVKKPRGEMVVPGVKFYFAKSLKKPYEVQVKWPSEQWERFATKEEALARRDEDVAAQVAEAVKRANDKKPRTEAERTFVTNKRAIDLEVHGNSSKQEHDVTNDLARAWTELTGLRSITLNDGTRADLLIALDAEATVWLCVQVKTANTNSKGNMWKFNSVKGYTGMPVVCWAVDAKIGWLHDGKDLEAMESGGLGITHNGMDAPRTSNEKEWDGKFVFDMKGLLDTMRSAKDRWPLVTEEFARWDFKGRENFVEMLTLETYRAKHPCKFDFPNEQAGRADLVDKPSSEAGNGLRVQMKSAHDLPAGETGFKVGIHVMAGTDDEGNQLKEPYESSDFDHLVVMYIPLCTWHAYVWEIPMSKLIEKGIVGHELFKGKTGFTVHTTSDTSGEIRHTNQSGWTRDFYKGEWNLPELTDVVRNARTKHEF